MQTDYIYDVYNINTEEKNGHSLRPNICVTGVPEEEEKKILDEKNM